MTCPLSTTQQALTMHLWLAWNTCLWLPSTGIKDLGSRSCTSPGAMTTRVLAPPSGLCEKPGTSTRLCVTCRKGGSGGNRSRKWPEPRDDFFGAGENRDVRPRSPGLGRARQGTTRPSLSREIWLKLLALLSRDQVALDRAATAQSGGRWSHSSSCSSCQ